MPYYQIKPDYKRNNNRHPWYVYVFGTIIVIFILMIQYGIYPN